MSWRVSLRWRRVDDGDRRGAAVEALRKARRGECADLPWPALAGAVYPEPAEHHRCCESALLEGFSVDEITEAGG